MYCSNCGHKLNDNACVCLNCGVFVKNNSSNNIKTEKKKDISGIISIIISVIVLFLCFKCFTTDISSVGRYTKVYERLSFASEMLIMPLILSIVTLVLSLSNKVKLTNIIGLFLTLTSLFLIITEMIVVVIY